MLRYLLAKNFIEIANAGSYRVGHYCKRYRLHPDSCSSIARFELQNRKLIARAEKTWTIASKIGLNQPGRKWLLASYKSADVAFDADEAVARHEFKSDLGRLCCEQLIAEVRAHRLRFKTDRAGARMFYPVTSLPEEVRTFITLDGEGTVEIDAEASQASLLASLYNRHATGTEFAEMSSYLLMLRRGIYETVAEWLGTGCTRKIAKKAFFRHVAFSCGFVEEIHPIAQMFRYKFPILWERMAVIKKRGNGRLPVMLQKLEAEIVLDGVLSECAVHRIKCLSVHDSLICKARDADRVEEIFRRHWREKVGFPLITTRSLA